MPPATPVAHEAGVPRASGCPRRAGPFGIAENSRGPWRRDWLPAVDFMTNGQQSSSPWQVTHRSGAGCVPATPVCESACYGDSRPAPGRRSGAGRGAMACGRPTRTDGASAASRRSERRAHFDGAELRKRSRARRASGRWRDPRWRDGATRGARFGSAARVRTARAQARRSRPPSPPSRDPTARPPRVDGERRPTARPRSCRAGTRSASASRPPIVCGSPSSRISRPEDVGRAREAALP